MNYKGRLTIEEREQKGLSLSKEYTYFEIAIHLDRAPSNIGREVYRNFSKGEYRAVSAYSQAKKRQRYSLWHWKLNHKYVWKLQL